MDWEDEFRPRKFRDVRAQPHALKHTAGRILRGVRPRPLMFTGAVGCGKTTHVRILAASLNCDQREPDASPCGACESCENPSRYLVEWDTAGRGGDLATVTGLLQQHI